MFRMFSLLQCLKLVLTRHGVWSPVKYIVLGYGVVFEVNFSIWQKMFVVCRVLCSPVVMDVCFTYGVFDRVFHALFRLERLFVAFGSGVVFVAHRTIAFVSCMEGLPFFRSLWCVVWLCHLLGSRAGFIHGLLLKWVVVGVVLSLLHVKTGSGHTKGKYSVTNVFDLFLATVAMLLFKGLLRAWSSFYIYLVFEKQI